MKGRSIHESCLFHVLLEEIFYLDGVFGDLVLHAVVANAVVED